MPSLSAGPDQIGFARNVRDALAHLYDRVYLRRHPLVLLLSSDPGAARPAIDLHNWLVQAIERLKPETQIAAGARAWRTYRLLHLRYVEARDPADVQGQLAMSKSQYYREHEHALEALTSLLWEQVSERTGPAQSRTGAAVATYADHPPHNLPIEVTSFIGRHNELAEAKRLLESTRLLTLTGAGGSGKTRLALHVAAELLARYPDGVWAVELAPLGEASLVPQVVAFALRVPERPGQTVEATLRQALAGKQLLVVLDNCEHVIDACARLVEGLIQSCPKVTILATSREPLQITGETVLRVPTLAIADPKHLPDVQKLCSYEAVQLFVDRAAAVHPSFSVSSTNARALAQICQRLDGIPLAIELAAARVQLLSLHQISERLEHRFELLTSGSRTAVPRHQTLQALVDWSYDLLAEPEKALLRRFSVFSGGWTLEAAEAVGSGDPVARYKVLNLLGQLVSKSLVVAEETASHTVRYRMLDTFRQYGLERLTECGERARLFEAHARYFLALAESGELGLLGPAQLDWLKRLERERDNLRAVLARCSDASLPEDIRQEIGPALAQSLRNFWLIGGHMREGADWLASMAETSKAGVTPAVVFCYVASGYFRFILGEREAGRSLADRAVQLPDELADSKTRGWVHFMRAVVLLFSGDFAACERDVRLAVASADETDIDGLRALARMILGAALLNLGETGAAAEQLSRALELARTLQECFVMGMCLAYSGQLAMQCDEYALAESQLQESIRLFEKIDNHTSILRPANLLGQLALRQRDGAKAHVHYERNLVAAQEAGWLEHLASALVGLAMAAALRKQYEQAAQLFGAAHSLRSSAGLDPPPLQKMDEDRQQATIRASLAASVFDANWQKGTNMTTGEAVQYALSLSPAQ